MRNTYFENDIQTATPQKLHLMLIEGAIRFARQAEQQFQQQQWSEACNSLASAKGIALEILGGLQVEPRPELARNVAEIYSFVFRKLVEAQVFRSQQSLSEVLTILETERDTWREVCQQVPGKVGTGDAAVDAAAGHSPLGESLPSGSSVVPPPHRIAPAAPLDVDFGYGLSLEG